MGFLSYIFGSSISNDHQPKFQRSHEPYPTATNTTTAPLDPFINVGNRINTVVLEERRISVSRIPDVEVINKPPREDTWKVIEETLRGLKLEEARKRNEETLQTLRVLQEYEEEAAKKKKKRELLKIERWIKHYCSFHKILLVGEGDFSFSACLAKAFGSATNMVATSLDSVVMLKSKYPMSSEKHLKYLKSLGCLLLHEVDALEMAKNPILKTMKFDRIIFNFPHAGHFGYNETDRRIIRKHKDLLLSFFESTRKMLSDDGEVHVTHRDDHPYNRWEIEELAKKAALVLTEKVRFYIEDYPDYYNKRGSHSRSNGSFPLGDSFTFKFTLDLHLEGED